MRLPNVSDLPFPVGTILDHGQMNVLMEYCFNDVDATYAFYLKSTEQIKFREQLTVKHGIDFINYNDVKIGKEIFRLSLEKAGVVCYNYDPENGRTPRQTPRSHIALKDGIPNYICFGHPNFERVRAIFASTVITTTKSSLLNLSAIVDGLEYKFGTGGIHASVENESFEANDEMMIYDIDVTSLYPSIAIENGYYPEHLGPKFVEVYRNLREQRVHYPKGTPENAMLKLALNGVYGASNDPYSIFYDPLFTMKITIGGQLMIAMLVDSLRKVTHLRVIQANTDGITFYLPRCGKQLVDDLCKKWEALTGLHLEHVEYSKMAVADVNSYIAQGTNGKVKRKGRYEYDLEWHQNASALVVPKVAEQVILNKLPIKSTVENWPDKMDFMLRAKTPRSSQLVLDVGWGDIPLENTQRYYITPVGGQMFKIMPPLAKTPDKWRRMAVQKDCCICPCNDIADAVLPIDHSWYIKEIQKLVLGVI